MRIAGFGFRQGASEESLASALKNAGGAVGLTALATAASKAEAPGLNALAARLCVPIKPIPDQGLTEVDVPSSSKASLAAFGTGSLSEAAALLAVGQQAKLLAPRAVSDDRMATCAIAEREGA